MRRLSTLQSAVTQSYSRQREMGLLEVAESQAIALSSLKHGTADLAYEDPLISQRHSHLGYLNSSQTYRAARYPIVLCHGLFGYDRIGPDSLPSLQIRYWRGVYEALESLGCEVYCPQVGTVSSIRTRALQLKAFLETYLRGREVNLVAHSMGGLDTRYLISHLPSPHFHVNSLTTIATPHRGSSFMDWVRDTLGLGQYILHDDQDPVSRELRQRLCERSHLDDDSIPSESRRTVASHPVIRALRSKLDAPAFANLTTDFCRVFNECTPDVPTVHYCSYAAVADVGKLAPLYLPHLIIKKVEGPNDGLVSLNSAKWGDFEGIVGHIDHWDLIPPKIRGLATLSSTLLKVTNASRRDKSEGVVGASSVQAQTAGTSFDPLGFYQSVSTMLHSKGY
ncbi:hypothetical protein HDU96_009626 [Phlyctochytrium bullatum]|nr:hypothetical protein HDU96_009626 [Phlyctochytrium bullatum]